ncbi:MAG: phosphatidate cytidylyltransferase [Candidatus Izemoplasmatales bacterium]|jgi:phosphatidate cytidylyltransferase
MKKRTVTGFIMAIVMIPILIWGDQYEIFNIFCLLLSIGAAWEFRKMFQIAKKLPLWLDLLTIILTGILSFVIIYSNQLSLLAVLLPIMLLVFIILGIMLIFVKDFNGLDFGNALTTIIYSSFGFSALALLRMLDIKYVIFMILAAMVTDLFAFIFGMKFGKHKLIPLVSPNKSVEGAIAGLVFGTLIASLYGIFGGVFGDGFPVYWIILIALLLSCLSQIGDLVASKFKRTYGIKDYSNLFPGHGGIMDRFDSTTFAAMVFVVILALIEVF